MEEFFENELIRKFEEMVENNDELYFETEEYEDIIIYYLEMGDISFAEMATNYALKLHPNSLELKIKKFEVLLELENYTQAKELMQELQEASMESTDFLVCCAKYYSNLGNPDAQSLFVKGRWNWRKKKISFIISSQMNM